MKTLMAVLVTGMVLVGISYGEGGSNTDGKKLSCAEREKEYRAKKAEKYSKYAQDLSGREMSSCEKSASAEVKKCSEQSVELSKQLGQVYSKLADAVADNNKEEMAKLYEAKKEIDYKIRLADKEKQSAYAIDRVNSAAEKYPNSEKIKGMKADTEKLRSDYLDACRQMIDLEKKQSQIEKEFNSIGRKIEIIKYEEKIKSLKNEL
jgi:hypothetical protein